MFIPSQRCTLVRYCVLGQDTSHSRVSLHSGVNEYLVGQIWQCVQEVPSAKMAAGLYAHRGVKTAHE